MIDADVEGDADGKGTVEVSGGMRMPVVVTVRTHEFRLRR